MSENLPHIPILVTPILDLLGVADQPEAIWLDGTVGAGGHSHAFLAARPDSRLIGFDLDEDALALARARLAPFGERVTLIHASYESLSEHLAQLKIPAVDGILLDLGLSSMQLDRPERGFSFRTDNPLDMRFDASPNNEQPTAADLVNHLPEKKLADLIFQYGEERNSRRIAKAIVHARPLTTTQQLAELIAAHDPTPRFKQTIHPATRTFQALRIAVNDELGAVERVLPMAVDHLKVGGRLAVISFHSLEDRLVKDYFKQEATDCLCPPRQPICICGHRARLTLLTRKPIVPDETEINQNPRARSAKLRVSEKFR